MDFTSQSGGGSAVRRHLSSDFPAKEDKCSSSKCLIAWSEETNRKRSFLTSECHEAKKKIGHKRPLSLDLSSGGGVTMSPPVYLFIQMQLCCRESLKEWLRDKRDRSTDTVIRMFDQIVQAVEYVHLQGFIHRDLKVRAVHCECIQ